MQHIEIGFWLIYRLGILANIIYLVLLGKKYDKLVEHIASLDPSTWGLDPEFVKNFIRICFLIMSWGFFIMGLTLEVRLLVRMIRYKQSYYTAFENYVNENEDANK